MTMLKPLSAVSVVIVGRAVNRAKDTPTTWPNRTTPGAAILWWRIPLWQTTSVLTADIQVAYVEFKAETAAFGSTAPAIGQLNAAILFSKASVERQPQAATRPNIKNNLLRVLLIWQSLEDLMRFATIKQATIDQANATKTRTNVIVGQANTGYGMEFIASIAPGSLGSISGEGVLQPMIAQTVFASLLSNGSVPYEVGGLSVTVGGVAVPVLYASPKVSSSSCLQTFLWEFRK